MNSPLITLLRLKQTDCSVVVPHLPTLIILWNALQSFQSWTPNFIPLRIVVVIKLWSYYQIVEFFKVFFFFWYCSISLLLSDHIYLCRIGTLQEMCRFWIFSTVVKLGFCRILIPLFVIDFNEFSLALVVKNKTCKL